MKSFILTIGTLLISYPLVAQTNFSGTALPSASPTGAPVFDPGNTAPIPPTINSTPPSPVSGTGAETGGFGTQQVPPGTATGTGFGTGIGIGTGTGTGFGTGAGSTAPIPPATGTTQPATGNSIMGSGWQGI